MHEVFKPEPSPPDRSGPVFYTITADDIGRSVIETTIGPICLTGVIGRVQRRDTGHRLYGTCLFNGQMHWSYENDSQYAARIGGDKA